MKEKENIAILLFSRSAKRESHSKRWTSDPEINVQIAEHLICNTYDQLKTAPFPIFQVDEKLQSGNSFGERLANAFRIVFQKGFDYVIAVGNDCPILQVDWNEISLQLLQQKTVLGPDKRGGAYMIGLSVDSDFESKLLKISWKSRHVFHQLKKQFTNCHLLAAKTDINTLQDVVKLKYLFSRIKGLLYNDFSISLNFVPIPNQYLSIKCLRAPPLSLSLN